MSADLHPDWQVLTASWDLSLRADGYSANTLRTYRTGLASLTDWLADNGTVPPADLTRDHIRGWLAHVRETRGATTAKTWMAGVKHFAAWLVAEGEATVNATDGVRYPTASEPATPVLSEADLRRLLAACQGTDFAARRDTAIILTLLDGGLRLAELVGLQVDDANLEHRTVFVTGKGSRRSGPRHRAVPLGIKAAQALDRYLRVRRRHPYAADAALWLGTGGQRTLGQSGVVGMLQRRGEQAGIPGLHAHVFRHTFASAFRRAGGTEGDLMVLGGWRNRTMLDRYGAAAAAEVAAESYRRLSLGDRL
jgi:integrase/recombinase XerC